MATSRRCARGRRRSRPCTARPIRRVSVAGISGSGKTTFARALAERLGVAYIELDALHHGPNWAEANADELRARVETAIAAAPDGWVIDGNREISERSPGDVSETGG